MLRKTALLALAMMVMASPAIASAQGYGTGNFLAVSDTTVVPGQNIVVTGCCFEGNVDIDFESTPQRLGTATAGADGAFSLTVTIPLDATLGAHALTATGAAFDGSGILKIRQPITVVAPGAGPGAGKGTTGALPRTGESTLSMVQLGGILVLAGAGMVLAVRSRRDAGARRAARVSVDA